MKRLVAALVLAACGSGGPKSYDRAAARGVFDEVDYGTLPGLSDLALDPQGHLWAIPERDRYLVELAVPAKTPEPGLHPAAAQVKLAGLPDDVDTESLAWLGPDRIAIGIEGQDTPTAGVAWATRKGDAFVVDRTLPLDDTVLGLKLKKNHGSEGLCALADGDLLVAIEETAHLPNSGARYAPIVRIHDGAIARVYQLVLATDVGKISALACTGAGHVAAIERHFGVSRLVTFEVPPLAPSATDAAPAPLHETLVLDLAPILRDSLNLEGLATLPDGRVVAIADNQSKTVEGPDALLVFAPKVRLK